MFERERNKNTWKMNNELIKKIINTDGANACPEPLYDNPLVDKNVAGAVAQSFIKMLRVAQSDSNVNNNMRFSVLSNIRKLCRIEPENHMEVDENFTKSLSEVYVDTLRKPQESDTGNDVRRSLDEFLVRKMQEIDLSPNYQRSINPEVAQALMNLSEDTSYMKSLYADVLEWDTSDQKKLVLIKNMWTNIHHIDHTNRSISDLALKIRPEIEIVLLNICHRIFTETNIKIEELFSENIPLSDLVKKSAQSSECFQICTKVLNYVFIKSNYNTDIQTFIAKFVKNVKPNCLNGLSILYPPHFGCVVILMDIDLEIFPPAMKAEYIEKTLEYLKRLHDRSQSDLVMVLSHFSQWFPIYFR